uniref:Calbindin-32 n=1 Tax=Magallana gigas TaxID=29159 RepID=K1PZJ5_MAGGI
MATSAEDKSSNFLRQFRDLKTREFKLLSAQQFMEVWNHYDTDGNGFIEGSELDSFLTQLVTSINSQDIGPERLDLGSYATVRRKLGCNKKSSHLPQHSVSTSWSP